MVIRSGIADSAEKALGELAGGHILDVATGSGGFITFLLDNIMEFTEITGIDLNEQRLASARSAYPPGNIHFLCMDATKLVFPDGNFDTVCMANSLHHMENLHSALSEMRRVCKPGGNFILNEMYRDDQSETQQTHVSLHHWRAEIDRAQGVYHRETYTRQELVEIIERVSLSSKDYFDITETDTNPMEAELIHELEGIIDWYSARTQQLNDGIALRERGEQLRQRLHTVGFQAASSILMIGKK